MNIKERTQEWLKFHDMQIDDLHQLVGDLLADLTTAEKERDEAIAGWKDCAEDDQNIGKELASEQDTNEFLRHIVGQIVNSLPAKRDWLDPVIEKAAREALKRGRA